MSDYLPNKDVDLQLWTARFVAYVSSNLAHLGLVAGDIVDLAAAEPEFSGARIALDTAYTAYKSALSERDLRRESLVDAIRPLVARIQTNPETTNVDREAMWIPLRGNAPSAQTVAEGSPDRPTASIDIRALLTHTLRIENTDGTTTTKGKPEGVKAVEVWVKVGEQPTGEPETDMRYVNMSSKNTMAVPFTTVDGNKQAHYKLRWVYKNGIKGGWSDLQSATIAA